MINVKKGTAHSLQQSDLRGKAKSGEAVVAGMLCNINTSGEVIKGVTSQGVANLLGFAINDQTDGDVIESGKIALYALDGNSVIETDQAAADITSSNYPVGTRLAGSTTTGLVKAWESGDRIIGYVEGIRSLPTAVSASQAYLDADSNSVTTTKTIQKRVALLAIKLAV
ncbi:MAG: hypothetical protein EBU46_00970 [Nitrosomonadaceae bacterium]|nr:hypothetical protein [Nitrosomonadaceae bacterium]